MEIEPFLLLQRYRRDRRRLLEFVISSVLHRDSSGVPFDFSTVDLDTLSVDYVLECAQLDGEFDPLEAARRYLDEWNYPITMNLSSGSTFFLISKPELSGSPPRRAAPPVGFPVTFNHSCTSEVTTHLDDKEIERSGSETIAGEFTSVSESCKLVKDANVLTLGLRSLSTGLSDDDIRETAYEVLLGSLVFSGSKVLIASLEERKSEKKTRFKASIRSKKEGSVSHELSEDDHSDLLDVIRGQMEISEKMDACIKQGLRHFYSNAACDRTDVPQIVLELLMSVNKFDFPNQKSYKQWLKQQANVLEELLLNSDNFVADERTVLKMLLSQLKNSEEWVNIGPEGHAEILTCIKGFASRLSSSPPKFGIPSECYYWNHCYHFNIKIYEKLLCSVFDVLEDGQIVEEAEEILRILQLTWPILGITQKLHDALYSWSFFQQFVLTGEYSLLEYAVFKMQRLSTSKNDRGSEDDYLDSLICSIEVRGTNRSLKLVDAILFNIFAWCGSQLEDYHLHFDQEKFHTLECVLTMAVHSGSCFFYEYGEIKFIKSLAGDEITSKLVHMFIERSIQAAYRRALNFVDTACRREQKHPLTILANKLKLIAEKEFTSFIPVLCQRYPKAGVISSVLLHQLYGEQLNPILKGVTDLADGICSALAASDSLELYLVGILNSVCGNVMKQSVINHLQPYQIREVCAPLILHWVNAQHDNVLEWTRRAIHIEDWEPLSSHQRQAASVIEVFRIIEETIDQFFDLNLPMDIIHLRSLLIGISRCLDAYLLHIVNQQVDKNILYPIPPALTRYAESLIPFTKRKTFEGVVLEGKVTDQLSNLTVSKLCVKLNTLHYIRDQLDALEDSIQQSWVAAQSVKRQNFRTLMGESSAPTEVVELFTIFDDIRRSAIDASNVIFDFIGARVIFWDMRDSFLFSLYRVSVERSRMEKLVPELDEVLDDICSLITDTLRDRAVLSVFQASMDGFVWVLLDGGPSRAFSETDVPMMQEDLNILKDLFVADGQGLPLFEVEKESGLAQQILDLYGMKSHIIIEMLKSASDRIPYCPDIKGPRSRSAKDADTLLRVLCHKRDNDASEFLKLQYQLPKSSDYEDAAVVEQSTISPLLSDILKRNASFSLTEKGRRSFSIMRKKFQGATSETTTPR